MLILVVAYVVFMVLLYITRPKRKFVVVMSVCGNVGDVKQVQSIYDDVEVFDKCN
mgnify:CR=1 FL=1